MFKKLFFVCVFIITGMSGYGALAQSNAPDPTPGVEAVAPITITSDKSGICAGGIDSEPHRSVITASLSPTNNADIAGKSIRFTLENSDPDYPAYIKDASSDGSKTVSTDNDGNASIILISSHLIGSTTTVKAIYGEAEKETFVSTVDAEGDMTVDADELVADGQSTANVYLALTYNDEPVNGHNINFHILSVVDANGTPVAPSSDGSFPGYGSVAAVQGTTDDAGIAYATYTAGTLPGTITFESDDNSALIAENMTAGSFSVSSSSPRIVQVKPRKRQKPLGSAGTKRPVVTVSVNFFYVYKGTVRPTTSLTPQSTITKLNSVWLPQAQVKFKAKSTTQYQQALPSSYNFPFMVDYYGPSFNSGVRGNMTSAQQADLNVYFVPSLYGSDRYIGGAALPGYMYISDAGNTTKTLAHEAGHALSLPHIVNLPSRTLPDGTKEYVDDPKLASYKSNLMFPAYSEGIHLNKAQADKANSYASSNYNH